MTEILEQQAVRVAGSRYTLLEKLGSGGQAEVRRAHDEVRGLDVALKLLGSATLRGESAFAILQREYAIASRLDHPAILKVFPPERAGDVAMLPMELASGGDLRRLRGAGYLEIVPVLIEIALALDHAHERGVVHRDLKPGNVLFDSRGRVKLADFGVAGTLDDGPQNPSRGLSPFTASPEQLRGEPPSAADDVYGLGALAYELLSGHPPHFPQFDPRRALLEPVPDLAPARQIPPQLQALVMKMLSKRAAERPASMRDVIEELESALNDTLSFDYDNATISMLPAAGATPLEILSSRAATRDEPDSKVGLKPDRFPPRPPGQRAPAVSHPGDSHAASFAGREGHVDPARVTGATAIQPHVPAHSRAAPMSAHSAAAPSETFPRRLPDQTLPQRAAASLAMGIKEGAPQSTASGAHAKTAGLRSTGTSPYGEASDLPVAVSSSHASLPQQGSVSGSAVRTAPHISDASIVSTGRPSPTWSAATLDAPRLQQAEAQLRSEGVHRPLENHPNSSGTVQSREASAREARALWDELKLIAVPPVARLEPMRSHRWPWVLLLLLAVALAGAYGIPRYAPGLLPPQLADLMSTFTLPDSRAEPQSVDRAGGAASSVDSPAAAHAGAPTDPDSTAQVAAAGQAAAAGRPAPEGQAIAAQTAMAGGETTRDQAAATRPEPSPSTADPTGARATAATHPARALSAPTRVTSATNPAASAGPPSTVGGGPAQRAEQRLSAARAAFDRRLFLLDARGAAKWGGSEYGEARILSAQSMGARDAGNTSLALTRLNEANRFLDKVEQRPRSVSGVAALLTDAQSAERAHNHARATQDYAQALSLDPQNAQATEGLARANAAFGDDGYAKAVGAGFAYLGAGRLEQARQSFEKARAFKINGPEASEGLRRVGAALAAQGAASARQRAASYEAQERWADAVREYEGALKSDPGLQFALLGKARAGERADLANRLQDLIDHPDSLATPQTRDQARSLLETARSETVSGPVLRSQIARLEILLPQFDRAVRLSLFSDNATQVAIASVGALGTFGHRDIELKPGRYTVIGTRTGFREVRRDITVQPGQVMQTINVFCSDPI